MPPAEKDEGVSVGLFWYYLTDISGESRFLHQFFYYATFPYGYIHRLVVWGHSFRQLFPNHSDYS